MMQGRYCTETGDLTLQTPTEAYLSSGQEALLFAATCRSRLTGPEEK